MLVSQCVCWNAKLSFKTEEDDAKERWIHGVGCRTLKIDERENIFTTSVNFLRDIQPPEQETSPRWEEMKGSKCCSHKDIELCYSRHKPQIDSSASHVCSALRSSSLLHIKVLIVVVNSTYFAQNERHKLHIMMQIKFCSACANQSKQRSTSGVLRMPPACCAARNLATKILL